MGCELPRGQGFCSDTVEKAVAHREEEALHHSSGHVSLCGVLHTLAGADDEWLLLASEG